MKDRHIGFGIFLLTIGLLWILMNFGILTWPIFDAAFKLWPLIFVVIGINIIFKNNAVIKTVVWLAFLAAIILYGYFAGGSTGHMSPPDRGGNISIEKPAETRSAKLNLELGGATVEMGSTGEKLVDAAISDPDIKHSVTYENGKETAVVNIDKTRVSVVSHESVNSSCRLDLNDGIPWDMVVKTGAVKGGLDLSRLKVRSLNLNVGAAKLDLTLGGNYESTMVKIGAGASSIDVNVPEDAGVKIKIGGALNSTNLKELGWVKEGDYYVSPNYNGAAGKIQMDVDMGVGSFKVNVTGK
ncbi:MAG: DUF5668 domain-containing protein [Clostridiales bacterium]|jgi:hypothetical protein|nr:DUF5668 domain-containing protein [Eubacteriales bacterium]MDH7566764.1 DUF5668 domain-containing protein [Clostridiales bacterium]